VYASPDAARVGGGLYQHLLEAVITLATDPAPSVAAVGAAVLRVAGMELAEAVRPGEHDAGLIHSIYFVTYVDGTSICQPRAFLLARGQSVVSSTVYGVWTRGFLMYCAVKQNTVSLAPLAHDVHVHL
jgi:hypothetical protein